MLVVSLWLVQRLLRPPGEEQEGWWRHPALGACVAVLCTWRFVDSNMFLSNANVVNLFLLALGLWAAARGKGVWSGAVVALATAYKLTPAVFGAFFCWTRRGRGLLGWLAGLLCFLVLVPTLVLGWEGNLAALGNICSFAWRQSGGDEAGEAQATVGKEDAAAGPISADGISLRGTFLKVLAPTVALKHRPKNSDRSVNLADLTPRQAGLLAYGASLLLLGLTVFLTWPRTGDGEAGRLAQQWGLTITTMVMIAPLTRKAHCVVLLIPVLVLIALLQNGRLSRGDRRSALAGVLSVGVTGLLGSEEVIGERASEVAHAWGILTWGILGLYVAQAALLYRARAANACPRGPFM